MKSHVSLILSNLNRTNDVEWWVVEFILKWWLYAHGLSIENTSLRPSDTRFRQETRPYFSDNGLPPVQLASHYLNSYWLIVSWTFEIMLKWNFSKNSSIPSRNAFENAVCKMAVISSRPQCGKCGYGPLSQIAISMAPTWGPPGFCRPQVGPTWHHEPCYQGPLFAATLKLPKIWSDTICASL